jgi:hypothetical protein
MLIDIPATITGFKLISYTSKRTNKPVNGFEYYIKDKKSNEMVRVYSPNDFSKLIDKDVVLTFRLQDFMGQVRLILTDVLPAVAQD